MYDVDEIDSGLVVHIDPDVLEQNGGTYTGAKERRVQGRHAFLIMKREGEKVQLAPLFTNNGPSRHPISTSGRTGHPWWVKGIFYWHEFQVWSASAEAVVTASATDLSTPTSRNRLAAQLIPVSSTAA